MTPWSQSHVMRVLTFVRIQVIQTMVAIQRRSKQSLITVVKNFIDIINISDIFHRLALTNNCCKHCVSAAIKYSLQAGAAYSTRESIMASNTQQYGAANVAQTPYLEVACFGDVVDIILECESSVQRYIDFVFRNSDCAIGNCHSWRQRRSQQLLTRTKETNIVFVWVQKITPLEPMLKAGAARLEASDVISGGLTRAV